MSGSTVHAAGVTSPGTMLHLTLSQDRYAPSMQACVDALKSTSSDRQHTRMLPRRSTLDSVWLNMSRSASALAPSPSPILHHPTFSVSTCGMSELKCDRTPRPDLCRIIAATMSCGTSLLVLPTLLIGVR